MTAIVQELTALVVSIAILIVAVVFYLIGHADGRRDARTPLR